MNEQDRQKMKDFMKKMNDMNRSLLEELDHLLEENKRLEEENRAGGNTMKRPPRFIKGTNRYDSLIGNAVAIL